MKLQIKKGTTSHICHVFIQDSSAATGDGLTGLLHSNVTAYYIRPGDASATAISLVTATVGTYASGGFKEVSSANMPGVYELHLPDAVLATGANQVTVMLKGATDMPPSPLEIQLTGLDLNNAVNAGLSSLPAAAPAAVGGLPTVDASNHIAGIIAAVTVGEINSAGITDIWATDTLSEGYATDGSAANPSQMLHMIWSALSQFDIAGTTITCRQLNGTTAAMEFTMNDASDPSSRVRSS